MLKQKKYSVIVKNLVLKASIGIYPKEKKRKQKVRFNISINAKDNINIRNVISDFISYDDVIKNVKDIINSGHIPLVENLADKIASKCLRDKRVLNIEIMVEKLEPFKESESVGVKIIRTNKNDKK